MNGNSLFMKSRSQLPLWQSRNTDKLACATEGRVSAESNRKAEEHTSVRKSRAELKKTKKRSFNCAVLPQKRSRISGLVGDQKPIWGFAAKQPKALI
jgi:hypothetical protein